MQEHQNGEQNQETHYDFYLFGMLDLHRPRVEGVENVQIPREIHQDHIRKGNAKNHS